MPFLLNYIGIGGVFRQQSYSSNCTHKWPLKMTAGDHEAESGGLKADLFLQVQVSSRETNLLPMDSNQGVLDSAGI